MSFPGIATTLLFIFSTLLALGVVGIIAVLMHISMFYITSQRGVKIIGQALVSFFAGGLISLPNFATPFQKNCGTTALCSSIEHAAANL